MKKFWAVFLLLAVIGSVFCACENNKPTSIYDIGLKIEETNIRLFGEVDACIINDRLAVSKEIINKWNQDTSVTFDFLIHVFDEYDLDINFDKECSKLTKEIGYSNLIIDTLLQQEGYENNCEYIRFKKLRDNSEQRINERIEELKDKKAEDLKSHLEALGVTYEPYTFGDYAKYDLLLATLTLDQALTLLDTRFVYIEIADIHEQGY